MDEEQEQQMDMKFLIYGTRTSKDKSGAYLFLPDSEAKVPAMAPTVCGVSWIGRPWHPFSLCLLCLACLSLSSLPCGGELWS